MSADTPSRVSPSAAAETNMQPVSFICGPTCGCGKATRGVWSGAGWSPPTHCGHCGQPFPGSFRNVAFLRGLHLDPQKHTQADVNQLDGITDGLIALHASPRSPSSPVPSSETLTPRDWTVIRLAVDIAKMGLEVNPCPDLSTEEQAGVLKDYEAISEKIKDYPLRPPSRGTEEEFGESLNRYALAWEAYIKWEPEVGGARYPTSEKTELDASTAALQSYVSRLREERRDDENAFALMKAAVRIRDEQIEGLTREVDRQQGELDEARGQLSRIQQTELTAEEADLLMRWIGGSSAFLKCCQTPEFAKLKSLAALRSLEGDRGKQEQKHEG